MEMDGRDLEWRLLLLVCFDTERVDLIFFMKPMLMCARLLLRAGTGERELRRRERGE